MPSQQNPGGVGSGLQVGSGVAVGSRRGDVDRFVLRFDLPGEGHRRTGLLRLLDRYDAAGGQNLNQASATAVTFATESRRDGDFYAAVGSFSTRFKALIAGTYRFAYSIVLTNAAAGAASIESYVTKNGGSAIVGSYGAAITPNSTNPKTCLTGSIIVDLAANDYLEVFGIRAGGGTGAVNTVANRSRAELSLLSTAELPSARVVCDRVGRLLAARVSKGFSGTSGTTEVDVLVGGSSVLTSAKLDVPAASAWLQFGHDTFTEPRLQPGQEVTVKVLGVESPAPRDLRVELLCEAR